ncbi:MAG: peptidase domain-containing ABC transporter [Lentisphaerae bacterium]|nr:peptidase domain-containing ABC transporter [Lentisphaerota bacterium]
MNLKQLKTQEKAVIYDPLQPSQQNTLSVPVDKIFERAGETLIIFRNLREIDLTKHSALFALCSIASHHNVAMNPVRVMHEYAVGEDELNEQLLMEIAINYGFRVKKRRLNWTKLTGAGKAFPFIGKKKNGKYVVLCGFRTNEQEEQELIIVDPEKGYDANDRFVFMPRNEYENNCLTDCILLKKIYHLSDEEQPFGLRWFIPEFLKLRGIFAQIILVVTMLTLISLVIPLFFQIVVDKVLVHKSYNTLNVLGFGVAAAVLVNGLLEFVRGYLLLFSTNKIDINTATKTFSHLMKLPVDFFERVSSGVLLKHMQQTEKIRGFLSGNLFFTFLDLIALCIFIPFLLLYSVKLTLVVLGFSALMALVIACLIKPFQHRLNELYQAEGKRQSMLVESIHGIRTVKSLSLEPVEEKYWNDSTAYAIKSYFNVGKISISAKSISQILEMLMTITIIWLGAHLVFAHEITIGALIAFQMLSGRVTGPLVKLVGLIHEYQQIALSVRMLGVVMNTPSEPAGGGVRNPFKGAISYENVSFQYRPDTPQVIRNFTVDIQPGSTVGIVGRSGSGKTTLTKLIQGLYPITQGLIRIDGIDIREIDKVHLRSSIGVVLQENYFFSGTVRENISLTKRSASQEEIIYAAKLAGADEFIQKLQRGYDTVLEENASNLSGGQKQRLAIARALLTNPPILIFDEATSALDPESECLIRKNLNAIARGRTVVIVSHRLSIVRHADRILVIDDGELSASGTHRELLAQSGTYREFWTQQMDGENG